MNNNKQSASEYLDQNSYEAIRSDIGTVIRGVTCADNKAMFTHHVLQYGELVRAEYAESLRCEDTEEYLTNNSFTHETECYFDPKEDYVNPLSGTISHNYKSDTIDVVSIDIAEIYGLICSQQANDKWHEKAAEALEQVLSGNDSFSSDEQLIRLFKQKLSEG